MSSGYSSGHADSLNHLTPYKSQEKKARRGAGGIECRKNILPGKFTVTGVSGRWKMKLIGCPETRYWLLVTVAVLALPSNKSYFINVKEK